MLVYNMNFGVTQTWSANLHRQYLKKDSFRFEGDTKKGSFRQTSYAGCFSATHKYIWESKVGKELLESG